MHKPPVGLLPFSRYDIVDGQASFLHHLVEIGVHHASLVNPVASVDILEGSGLIGFQGERPPVLLAVEAPDIALCFRLLLAAFKVKPAQVQ